MKRAIIESVDISPQKIVKIFPPVENFEKYKKRACFNSTEFFYPASNSVYKNHKCIYDACKILSEKGIGNYSVSLTILGETNNERIKHLGTLPFGQVIEKYNSSTLIFPSYIETVGLPLVEARQMGTLILVADCPYSREVLNGYVNAYFFDPFRPEQLADLMEKVITGHIKKVPVTEQQKKENSWYSVVRILESVNR